MRALASHAIAMLRSKRLVVLHLVLNAVLLVFASLWLLIPEERAWQIVASVVAALLLLACALWLHAGTFRFAADPKQEKFSTAFRVPVRATLWLLAGMAVLFWCMSVVGGWTEFQARIAVYVYSKSPSFLRPVAGDSTYHTAIGGAFEVLFWFILPALGLPFIAATVLRTRLRVGLHTLAQWRYWLSIALTALIGIWLPQLILNWTPGDGLRTQSISLGIRLIIAYLLATLAWLITVSVLAHFARWDRVPEVSAEPPSETPHAPAASAPSV